MQASRALTELDGNARTQPAPQYIIFLDGIQDEPVTADQIIARHRQLIVESHALGLKIMGGTIPPFEGTALFKHADLDEANRRAVNAWIRTSGAYDGVIDFDLATSDPQHPARLLPAYDGGDHLHLNETGYRAMADAIDLSLFAE
jgi:lysophospholipase L1-like esterase